MASNIFAGVRSRLVALVLAMGLPVAVVAGANAWEQHEQRLETVLEEASLLGQAASARNSVALDDQAALLAGLATFLPAARAGAAECSALLAGLCKLSGDRYANLWVLDPAGRLLCDARGTAAGEDFSAQPSLGRATRAGGFALGDFVSDPLTGQAVLPGAMPLREDGRVLAIAGAAIRTAWMAEAGGRAARQADTQGAASHRVWVFDPSQRPSALGGGAEADLPAPALLRALRESPGRHDLLGISVGGREFAYSIGPPDRELRVLVGLPASGVQAEAWRQFLARVMELVLFLIFCFLVVLAGTELGCARPLRRLARAVRAWQPGTPFHPAATPWDPTEVSALAGALGAASSAIARREAELGEALAGRDRLLSEIHHRVKNNLQIVASLLAMQHERVSDPALREEFSLARERVQALAALHRHLDTLAGATAVPMAPLLRELASQLASEAQPVLELDEVTLPTDHATSLALLVTEALLNATRHAFPAGAGRIRVALRRAGGAAVLEVEDDGAGLPDRPAEGMGLALIRGFAAHLGGEAEIGAVPAGGTRVRVRFPLEP